MKWLNSTLALAAFAGAAAVSDPAFAYHGYWRHHHHGPRADVSLGFTVGTPWYAPAPYYYEPVPRYYYRPAPRYYYERGYAPGYYYYPYPSAIPYDNSND